MLQNIVGGYDDSDAINDAVASLESCKYCKVKDIRILEYGSYSVKAQIDYDMGVYTKNTSNNKDLMNTPKDYSLGATLLFFVRFFYFMKCFPFNTHYFINSPR